MVFGVCGFWCFVVGFGFVVLGECGLMLCIVCFGFGLGVVGFGF